MYPTHCPQCGAPYSIRPAHNGVLRSCLCHSSAAPPLPYFFQMPMPGLPIQPKSETDAPVQAAAAAAAGGPIRRRRLKPAAALTAETAAAAEALLFLANSRTPITPGPASSARPQAAAAAAGPAISESIQLEAVLTDKSVMASNGIYYWIRTRLKQGVTNYFNRYTSELEANIASLFYRQINPSINGKLSNKYEIFCAFILTLPEEIQTYTIYTMQTGDLGTHYSAMNFSEKMSSLKEIMDQEKKGKLFSVMAPLFYDLLHFLSERRGHRSKKMVDSFTASACFLLKSVEREYRLAFFNYGEQIHRRGMQDSLLYKLYKKMGQQEFINMMNEFHPTNITYQNLHKMLLRFCQVEREKNFLDTAAAASSS